MFDVKETGKRIKEIRGIMKQEECAQKLGISRAALSSYENGSRKMDIEILYKFCDLFKVSADYLLGLSEVTSLDNKVQAACEVTGLNETAIEKLIAYYKDSILPECLSTLSNIISNEIFFNVMEELWNYGELSLQTEYIKEVSDKIYEISNNQDYSIDLRENFMIKFANYFNLSAEKIYCDSSYRKEKEENLFPENFSILYTYKSFVDDSKRLFDLSEYDSVKLFQQLMNKYRTENKKMYSSFKSSSNDSIKKFYRTGFDRDRPLTNEEQKFKEYISELFK